MLFAAVFQAAGNEAGNYRPSGSKRAWTTRAGTDAEWVDTWTQTQVSVFVIGVAINY